MNPVLKYRGGKAREISKFEAYIPKEYDRYIEPFFGGGALYFYLEPKRAVINDLNTRLMGFYMELRDQYPLMREQLNAMQTVYEENQKNYMKVKINHPDERIENQNEAFYYELRKMYNHLIPSKYLDGVIYYFINKTAYSGMVRYNKNGEYNVPFGRYANFNTQIMAEKHSQLLQHAEVYNLDYSKIFAMAGEDDFMFLDPPYDCTFNDYGNLDVVNGFDEEQHRRLADEFGRLKCRALMIIGKTPLIEELYGSYIKEEYHRNYAVNIRNRFNAGATHVIVTNY